MSDQSKSQMTQAFEDALEEAQDSIKVGETGKFWSCPSCWWEGPHAQIDIEEWEISCPECENVLAEVPTP